MAAKRMTKAQARAWRTCWQLVNERSVHDAREASPDQRLEDLASLFALAHSLRKGDDAYRKVEQARRRWVRLKELARGR